MYLQLQLTLASQIEGHHSVKNDQGRTVGNRLQSLNCYKGPSYCLMSLLPLSIVVQQHQHRPGIFPEDIYGGVCAATHCILVIGKKYDGPLDPDSPVTQEMYIMCTVSSSKRKRQAQASDL